MTTKKGSERPAAQHETPSPAVRGRLHTACPSFDHLASAGGGPPPAPDVCREITSEYIAEISSIETTGNISAAIGMRFDEMAALPAKDFDALARRKPLEVIALLVTFGLGASFSSLVPPDVTISFYAGLLGLDAKPYLGLDPDEGLEAILDRTDALVGFLGGLALETQEEILMATALSGDFTRSAREAGHEPPRLH